LIDYQKCVDEKSDLADAIMGMYQVDTSPQNIDLEIEEEEERMSGWVNSLTIYKVFLYYTNLEPIPSPSHTIVSLYILFMYAI